MKLFTKLAERVEDTDAALQREEAERLASVAFPSPEYQLTEQAEAAIEFAKLHGYRAGGFDAQVRQAIPRLAEKLGRSEDEIRDRIVELLTISKRRQAWLAAMDIEEEDSPDARAQAEATLKWILRRRAGIELRLEDKNLTRTSRKRMEAELAQLEKQENENWSQIHPPYFPGRELQAREAKCKCGAVMAQTDKYRLGACDECRARHYLRTGKPYPAINV